MIQILEIRNDLESQIKKLNNEIDYLNDKITHDRLCIGFLLLTYIIVSKIF